MSRLNSMNFQCERPNMNNTVTRIFGLAVLLTAMPLFASIEWEFSVAGSPSLANNGTSTASVTSYGDGWVNQYSGFGTAQGYWDLGSSGSILLGNLGLTSSGTYTLKIYQWVDTGFGFPGAKDYTIIGGTGGSGTLSWLQDIITPDPTGFGGGWQIWNATIDLSPSQTILLSGPTGAHEGAIIDKVMLTVVPEPATLIAGALLLVPFAFSTIRIIRKPKAAALQERP
jgi:hypothetical protein